MALAFVAGVYYERSQHLEGDARVRLAQAEFNRQLKAEREKFAVRLKEYEIINQAVAKQQAENLSLLESLAALEDRLTFYRRMTKARLDPVVIEGFDVQPTLQARQVKYRLLVLRNNSGAKPAQAVVRVTVSDGRKSHELSLDQSQAKLRYYQLFSGSWVLPDGFKPTHVNVDISVDKARIKRQFKWELTL